ncbi:hypothetical protein PENTCL1PPCAC_26872, partial [Pristionchus entomophagus]
GFVAPKSWLLNAAGVDHYMDSTTISCKDTDCNENFDKAWTVIGKPYPAYLSSDSISPFRLIVMLTLVLLL